MEITNKYLRNNIVRVLAILLILNWASSKSPFRMIALDTKNRRITNALGIIAVILLIFSFTPLTLKIGDDKSSSFTKDDEAKAGKALKKIEHKLEGLMKNHKIWGFGVAYDPQKWGDKIIINVFTEKITPELLKKIPKSVDGIEVKLEQGSMPNAQ